MISKHFRWLFRKIDTNIFLLQMQVIRNNFEISNNLSLHPWDTCFLNIELENKNISLKKKIKELEDIKTIISCG